MKTEIMVLERQEALRALEESERRYRRLLAATTDYIYTVEVAHGVSGRTSHGPGCEAVTGYTSDEFAADGYLWYRVIHPEDREAVLAQVQAILQGLPTSPLEHRIIRKDGRIRWVRNTTIPHKDAEGLLKVYDGLITDITSQKRAELCLKLQYSVARHLAERPRPAEALPAVLQTLCLGSPWQQGIYWAYDAWEDELREAASWRRAAAGESSGTSPARLPARAGLPGRILREGTTVWVPDMAATPELTDAVAPPERGWGCACAIPVGARGAVFGVIELRGREAQQPDPDLEEVLGTVGVHLGLFLEQRKAQEALRESEERLKLVIQGSNDGVWDWNLETNEAYFSPRWKSMLGYADGEVENRYSAWIRLMHPDDVDRALECLDQYLAGQTPTYELEHRLRHKDGQYRWILARGVALRDPSGKPMRMAGSHVDLTERKHAAERLEEACTKLSKRDRILKTVVRRLRASHEELKTAQAHLIQAAKLEAVGTLAAGVAHEVKNPLQTILMGLHYLSHGLSREDADLVQTLGDMRDAVERANSIIRELLALSTTTPFACQPQDLNEVLQRVLRLVHNELVSSRISLQQELAEGLLPVPLDAGRIEQVFLNLVINSIQAMSNGGTLSVRTRSLVIDDNLLKQPLFGGYLPGDRLAVAEVQDTGTGIPEADLPRIYDPFFTTKSVGSGTGLGLFVARRIVDMHRGVIEIRNHAAGGVIAMIALKV